MKINFFDKVRVFNLKNLQLIKILKVILLSGSICIGIFFIITWNSSKLELLINDSGKVAILASALGSIVGGLVTYFTNNFSVLKQNKMKNALLNKKIIYEPLLIEFKHIKNEFNNRNGIIRFSFDPEYKYFCNAHFHVWGRIKNDTRVYRIPEYIRKYIDNLENNIKEYEEYKEVINEEVFNRLEYILKNYGYEITDNRGGIASFIKLGNIISEISVGEWEIVGESIVGMPKISREHVPYIVEELDKFLYEKKYAKVFNNNIENIVKILDKCIYIIEFVIINITKQYETNNMF